MSSKSNKIKEQGADRIFNIFIYAVAVLILILILYPLYFIAIASISEPSAVSNGKMWLFPVGVTLDGYSALLQTPKIWTGYRITILYTLVGTLIALAVNLSAAYALSRRDLVGGKFLMALFLIVMFFSGGLIPTFLIVRQLGLYDTFWVIVLPFSVSIFNVIVARSFFQGNIPEELLNAAQVDGCGNLRFFFQIVLPLSKAIISVIALWTAVGLWNSFFTALIYVRNENLIPLQLVLRNILITNQMQSAMGTGEAQQLAIRRANIMRFAAIIVSTVPIMCFYPFVQKHFNQGVMIGAVKG